MMSRVYECALNEDQDAVLLEECNRIFENPKQPCRAGVRVSDYLPDTSAAIKQLSSLLGIEVIIAIDAVNHLCEPDQSTLFDVVHSLTAQAQPLNSRVQPIKVLVACRSRHVFSERAAKSMPTLDLSVLNDHDIDIKLLSALREIPGRSEREVVQMSTCIKSKAW